MSVKGLLSEECVVFNLKSREKQEVICELVDLLGASNKINDSNAFRNAVLKREAEFSTGIGMGIAIPHGKGAMVNQSSIAFGRSVEGIDFDSIDGEPVYLLFMIAVPENESEEHLKAVAEISRKLMHKDIREKLLKAKNYEELIQIW